MAQCDISLSGEELAVVDGFRYQGLKFCKDASEKAEFKSRILQA